MLKFGMTLKIMSELINSSCDLVGFVVVDDVNTNYFLTD